MLKKILIGLGIAFALFMALVVSTIVHKNSMTPEERRQHANEQFEREHPNWEAEQRQRRTDAERAAYKQVHGRDLDEDWREHKRVMKPVMDRALGLDENGLPERR